MIFKKPQSLGQDSKDVAIQRWDFQFSGIFTWNL